MITESVKKKLSFKQPTNIAFLDVFLDLFTTIIRKGDEDICICSNIVPIPDNKNIFYEKEIIPNLEINLDLDGKFKLMDIITRLKILGYPLTGSMLSVYLIDSEDYVLMGSDPLDNNIVLSFEDFCNGIIKIRSLSYIDEKFLLQPFNNTNNLPPKFGSSSFRITRTNSIYKKSKRTKERKIGYIIEKVNTWRKLYNGFYDENGKFTKYSLDDAAKIIGISKKSLDDYLLQLRLGRKYGFDFNSNKNVNVGLLRSFVKEHRKKRDNK